MDEQRLDQLARAIGRRGTRRQAMRIGIAGVAGLTAVRQHEVGATLLPCAITCPPIVQVNDPSLCAALVTFQVLPNPGTVCTGIVCDQTPGTLFPVGSTAVHCNDIDGRADCDFTITVTDGELPTVTCPANIDITGPVPAIVTFSASTSDNCLDPAVACTPASGSAFAAGTTVVTCTATDASNNETSCEFNVTVTPDATATPTETATTEPTGTPTEEATIEQPTFPPFPTFPPPDSPPTGVPTIVAPTAVPGAPTATIAPVSQLPNTGAGSGGSGAGKLISVAAVGAGAALVARLGIRRASPPSDETPE